MSASCILPGRAPNRKFRQKYDVVDSFYSLSRLGFCVFQKHCTRKLWLQPLNDQIKLTNEKIYPLWFFWKLHFFESENEDFWSIQGWVRGILKMMRDQLCNTWKYLEGFHQTEALLYGSSDRKPGWRFTDRLKSDRGPSVRVSRAETRLTVYRSAYIRMLCQLVASFRVERLIINFDKNMMMLIVSTREVGWE